MNKIISLIAIAIASSTIMLPLHAQTQQMIQTTSSKDLSFSDYPTYSGDDLGLTIVPSGFQFKLWSPKAEAVRLNVYDYYNQPSPSSTFELSFDNKNGVWSKTVTQNLLNKFYTFQIKQNGNWLNEIVGTNAKAVGTNGLKAAIIDLSSTNPTDWNNDKGPTLRNYSDAVIYEMHHRDFSEHANSGIVNKGKFIALLEEGTRSQNGQKTGIDHLKELGITHVHILPSFDFNSVDESLLNSNQYNWGYDPINYNVPEGSYSTNPADPSIRIKEMKEMVQALHNAGIGVIMDVVYNHTGVTENSNFQLTAPDYYYRQREDGSFSDASACGNETASERTQMRNFMLNSVKYWMNEYHIDGFRFDLMGIHDIKTMNEIASMARKINPNVIIYGEGWTAADSPLPVKDRALKEHVSQLDGIAVFSDDIRDAVKGHYSDVKDRGFASGKPGLAETVKIGIVGATAHPQIDYKKGTNSKFAYANSPEQVINYVSCHDDPTLTDKLRLSMPDASEEQRLSVAKLAQTIVMTSQGTPFIFAGEEVFRDKKGVHNSYKSPDSINAIDWNQKLQYRNQFDYYRNLIALRKAHPAFRMTTASDIAKHIVFDKVANPNIISYSIKDYANGDKWKEIKLIFNGNETPQQVKVKKGNWKIIAANGEINPDGIGSTRGGAIKIAPYSALILAQE